MVLQLDGKTLLAIGGGGFLSVWNRKSGANCWRANIAHVRQSRQYSGLDYQVQVLETFRAVLCSFGSSPGTGCEFVSYLRGGEYPKCLSRTVVTRLPLRLVPRVEPACSRRRFRTRFHTQFRACICRGIENDRTRPHTSWVVCLDSDNKLQPDAIRVFSLGKKTAFAYPWGGGGSFP